MYLIQFASQIFETLSNRKWPSLFPSPNRRNLNVLTPSTFANLVALQSPVLSSSNNFCGSNITAANTGSTTGGFLQVACQDINISPERVTNAFNPNQSHILHLKTLARTTSTGIICSDESEVSGSAK